MAEKYKKHELHSHILEVSGMYVGSVEKEQTETFIYKEGDEKFTKKTIQYVPALYKIFDEVIVNASDQATRLLSSKESDIKHVKNIKITIDKESGEISVYNDGDGIDIVQHEEYDNIYIPSLIFGELLTSTNYNKQEERIVGGVNGLGAKLANIFSTEFHIETVDHRRNKLFKQKFTENMYKKGKPSVTLTQKQPYTKITFKPDYARFGLTGLTDDIYELFHKRCIDLCAVTSQTVSVYFNGTKINIKDFERYADMYLGSKSEQPRIYEKCNDRWEVIVSSSDNGFNQVSFVNGICNISGGTNVQYITNQITKNLVEMAAKKKKTIKPNHLKENMYVFVKCSIVNPAFNSQSKETLTTPISKFGSKCELSDAFMNKLYKNSGIIEKASALTDFHDNKKLVKNDGKKTTKVVVHKLNDATLAGTASSKDCTLILTEGDSAASSAISGLSVVGREKFGVFPLRGKVINTADISVAKLHENQEITNLKKIIGLEHNKKYKDVSELRYGKILLLTDQDLDAFHIRGLIMNLFQSQWHNLFKMDNFLSSLLTPVVKAKNNSGDVRNFYNEIEYYNWLETDEGKRTGWKIKYYKGLGSSSDVESKEYFKNMIKTTYKYTEKVSDDAMDLAFNKKKADERKQWLMEFDKNVILDNTQKEVTYEDFINKELIHFSNRDIERSIPNICDGLKESQRKILFACFKKRLFKDEIKVAQLSGYTSEVSCYHHGETSLQGAIIGMAQNFIGSNNINLLKPNGQFGTRLMNGDDAASPRYIHTLLTNLCRLIFKEEDNCILKYKKDDMTIIEPNYYIPIIPMVLVNGAIGIGTGFSTNVPNYNPEDIINQCKMICNNMEKEEIDIKNSDDLLKAFNIINSIKFTKLFPYYLGYKGEIIDKEGKYTSKGVYKVEGNILTITEIPIGISIEDYKEFLEELYKNGKIKDFENHYTSKNIKFIIKLVANYNTANIENDFKLSSTRNLSINNLHLYSEKGNIGKYDNTSHIFKDWSSIRVTKYFERKQYQIEQMEKELVIISSKVQFILDIISGKIKILNVPNNDIIEKLQELKYPKISSDNESTKSYNYLLNMQISQLTKEKKDKLLKEKEKMEAELESLKKKTISKIWLEELNDLESEYNKYREEILEDYKKDYESYEKTMKKKK
jgi:DNA topoisomerase-2